MDQTPSRPRPFPLNGGAPARCTMSRGITRLCTPTKHKQSTESCLPSAFQPRPQFPDRPRLKRAQSDSILRCSKLPKLSPSFRSPSAKRVRVASPVHWHSKSTQHLEKKRKIIETQVPEQDLKQLLRDLSISTHGG